MMMSGRGHDPSTGHSNCPARGEPSRRRPNCPALLDNDLLREMNRRLEAAGVFQAADAATALLHSMMGCEEAAGVFQAAVPATALLNSTMGYEVMGCRRADSEVQLVSQWAAVLVSWGLG